MTSKIKTIIAILLMIPFIIGSLYFGYALFIEYPKASAMVVSLAMFVVGIHIIEEQE